MIKFKYTLCGSLFTLLFFFQIKYYYIFNFQNLRKKKKKKKKKIFILLDQGIYYIYLILRAKL